MSRFAPLTRSPHARRLAAVASAFALMIAAGCAQLQLPPPDAPAARLPESAAPATMTEAQQQDLTRLNKRIYDEQESTIERERAQRAIDDAMRSYANGAYYGGWGPGWYGPGWHGPGWYGPRSSVGLSVGF